MHAASHSAASIGIRSAEGQPSSQRSGLAPTRRLERAPHAGLDAAPDCCSRGRDRRPTDAVSHTGRLWLRAAEHAQRPTILRRWPKKRLSHRAPRPSSRRISAKQALLPTIQRLVDKGLRATRDTPKTHCETHLILHGLHASEDSQSATFESRDSTFCLICRVRRSLHRLSARYALPTHQKSSTALSRLPQPLPPAPPPITAPGAMTHHVQTNC